MDHCDLLVIHDDFHGIYPLWSTYQKRHWSHGPVEIVDFPLKNGGSFHSLYHWPHQPETMSSLRVGQWRRVHTKTQIIPSVSHQKHPHDTTMFDDSITMFDGEIAWNHHVWWNHHFWWLDQLSKTPTRPWSWQSLAHRTCQRVPAKVLPLVPYHSSGSLLGYP